jgi:hypothetical protein
MTTSPPAAAHAVELSYWMTCVYGTSPETIIVAPL